MKIMKKIITLSLIVAVLSSCEKKDETPAELPITTANLVGTYTLTAETTQTGSTVEDTYKDYEACEKDDTYVFTTSNITYSDAGIKCVPAGPTFTVPYTISGNQIVAFGVSSTIESLTSKTLKIVSTDNSGGVVTKITSTYTK